jgi:hypothetical protein
MTYEDWKIKMQRLLTGYSSEKMADLADEYPEYEDKFDEECLVSFTSSASDDLDTGVAELLKTF